MKIEYAAEMIEMGYHYLNDFPREYFPWLGLEIGCEAECGTRWGNAKGVHRGTTQQELEAILNKQKQS